MARFQPHFSAYRRQWPPRVHIVQINGRWRSLAGFHDFDVAEQCIIRTSGATYTRRYTSPAVILKEHSVEAVKDASGLYEVERRARHAERPGFRISELQLSPAQKVPWHYHTNVGDTFYVLEGSIRVFMRDPKQDVTLHVGESFALQAKRPHLVINAGDKSATFLVLQGVGEYDFVPLT
jgi:quercetin dioxygenase-like cupin family protein